MKMMDMMSIKQVDLNKDEMNLFSMFDTGTSDLFEFRVDTNEVDLVTFGVETIKDDKWETIGKFSAKLDKPYNRALIDFDYTKGGHFSVGHYDKEGFYAVTHGNISLPDKYKNLDLDEENYVIIDASYGKEYKIVKNKPMLLQLYYNDNEVKNELFDMYGQPEDFAEYKFVLAITATFTKEVID